MHLAQWVFCLLLPHGSDLDSFHKSVTVDSAPGVGASPDSDVRRMTPRPDGEIVPHRLLQMDRQINARIDASCLVLM